MIGRELSINQVREQCTDDGGVLRRPLPKPPDVLVALGVDAECDQVRETGASSACSSAAISRL
jgi:hypothetical protein